MFMGMENIVSSSYLIGQGGDCLPGGSMLILLHIVMCTHAHMHTRNIHTCTCSELCNACGDDDEYPLPQHRSSHQDSEANSELGRAGSRTQAERGIDHQWITMQLETWDR